MSHNASAYPQGYTDKRLYIDLVINKLLDEQLKEMGEQLRAVQAQTNQLQHQYGKPRSAAPLMAQSPCRPD